MLSESAFIDVLKVHTMQITLMSCIVYFSQEELHTFLFLCSYLSYLVTVNLDNELFCARL